MVWSNESRLHFSRLILAPFVNPSYQQGTVQICEDSIIIVTCVHAAGVEFAGSPKTTLINNVSLLGNFYYFWNSRSPTTISYSSRINIPFHPAHVTQNWRLSEISSA